MHTAHVPLCCAVPFFIRLSENALRAGAHNRTRAKPHAADVAADDDGDDDDDDDSDDDDENDDDVFVFNANAPPRIV